MKRFIFVIGMFVALWGGTTIFDLATQTNHPTGCEGQTATVPELSTMTILGSGLLGLIALKRRK